MIMCAAGMIHSFFLPHAAAAALSGTPGLQAESLLNSGLSSAQSWRSMAQGYSGSVLGAAQAATSRITQGLGSRGAGIMSMVRVRLCSVRMRLRLRQDDGDDDGIMHVRLGAGLAILKELVVHLRTCACTLRTGKPNHRTHTSKNMASNMALEPGHVCANPGDVSSQLPPPPHTHNRMCCAVHVLCCAVALQVSDMTSSAQDAIGALRGVPGDRAKAAVAAMQKVVSSGTPLRTAVTVAIGEPLPCRLQYRHVLVHVHAAPPCIHAQCSATDPPPPTPHTPQRKLHQLNNGWREHSSHPPTHPPMHDNCLPQPSD